ncbi:hypothetical protein [Agrococcus carbonis]|uniref:Uncharacterized protein n=1 Tax=Agrococcus carbonis TaxID=684552 RepID=A0A1H1RPU9_9MICO|nr:hypothetical protein [Agrococcus carbonis]SDS37622.1 hypothetical protein SAMN04489719_2178 [Agrococcus carbonis]
MVGTTPALIPRARRGGSILRRGTTGRMLAAVALTGAAALLAGCASGGPAAPPTPTAGAGAGPVPLGAELLSADGLFDAVATDGVVVRWLAAGESIAVVIGGSGGGGGCIPQPHAAEAETDGAVSVRFDPPDPAMACTADFTLHGWELGLPAPVDGNAPLAVRLVDLRGDGATTEVEIGPDDLLAAPAADPGQATADPQPSEVPPAGPMPEPSALPETLLPDVSIVDPREDPAVAVRWLEPGVSLAVLLGGSGVEACVPQPIGATSPGPGAIHVAFEYPTGDRDCSADLHLYGWELPLAEPVSATMPVEVTITGAGADGAAATVTLEPGDVLEGR